MYRSFSFIRCCCCRCSDHHTHMCCQQVSIWVFSFWMHPLLQNIWRGKTHSMLRVMPSQHVVYRFRLAPGVCVCVRWSSLLKNGNRSKCRACALHTFHSNIFFSAVMSENYIVFIEQPIKLDLLKFMLFRIQGKSFHKCMGWEPHYETIFHLVNRHTGKVCLARLIPINFACNCKGGKRKSWSYSLHGLFIFILMTLHSGGVGDSFLISLPSIYITSSIKLVSMQQNNRDASRRPCFWL